MINFTSTVNTEDRYVLIIRLRSALTKRESLHYPKEITNGARKEYEDAMKRAVSGICQERGKCMSIKNSCDRYGWNLAG